MLFKCSRTLHFGKRGAFSFGNHGRKIRRNKRLKGWWCIKGFTEAQWDLLRASSIAYIVILGSIRM